MRPEVDLLLCCADISIDTVRGDRIKKLLRTDLDWEYLLQTAGWHGVTPLLYHTLRRISPTDVPQAILEQLQHHSRANAARNLFLTDELLKLLTLLESHGVPALPYKGPVLTASIYGNLALREFADLDILVHERDYQRTQHLLSTSGYRFMKAFEWESTYVDGSGRVAVDLHQRMSPHEFPSPLQFEHVWERRHQTVLLGTKVPSLSPEDTLLMLAIQISKDAGSRYFQLAKLCDMAALLRAFPSLDLAQALLHARQGGGERMLLFSLALVSDLLGVRLPQACLRAMRFHPSIGALVEEARRQLCQSEDSLVTERQTVATFRWLVRERLRDKIHPYYHRYVHAAFVPCNLDRQLVPLPLCFAFLYYGIRPIRLLCKYGSLLFRGRPGSNVP
jgi:hypothetical protein